MLGGTAHFLPGTSHRWACGWIALDASVCGLSTTLCSGVTSAHGAQKDTSKAGNFCLHFELFPPPRVLCSLLHWNTQAFPCVPYRQRQNEYCKNW